eukprot:PLAT5355.3.p1 GENE.PLAT5355.3~~PLAT5355.3.p1  ORF type:complete len:574 (+),score=129.87 PLAT5355.3:39-1724(+)
MAPSGSREPPGRTRSSRPARTSRPKSRGAGTASHRRRRSGSAAAKPKARRRSRPHSRAVAGSSLPSPSPPPLYRKVQASRGSDWRPGGRESPTASLDAAVEEARRALSVSRRAEPIVIIEGRLAFLCSPSVPPTSDGTHVFMAEELLIYQAFFADFGPLNLSQLTRFCRLVDSKMEDASLRGKLLLFCVPDDPHKRTNGALLVAAYALLYQGMSVEDVFRPFAAARPPLLGFRDAAFGVCPHPVSVLDCLRSLVRARAVGFYDPRTFDVEAYDEAEALQNGDMNWIVPGKLLAFSGPHDRRRELVDGRFMLAAADYVPRFKAMGVRAVVRLNKKCYNEAVFKRAGIAHYDMFYTDGTVPTDRIMAKFMQICEQTRGGIAVHCKAGLGRTGTCIGLYLMKHFGFTAEDVTSWSRICRPGSILGPQHLFLKSMQASCWQAGEQERAAKAEAKVKATSAAVRDRPAASSSLAAGRGSGGGGGSAGRPLRRRGSSASSPGDSSKDRDAGFDVTSPTKAAAASRSRKLEVETRRPSMDSSRAPPLSPSPGAKSRSRSRAKRLGRLL